MHHGKSNMDVRKKLIPDHFFTMPKNAHTMLTTPELREVLLNHEGQIIAKGSLWAIRNENMGAGVHRVYLEEVGSPAQKKQESLLRAAAPDLLAVCEAFLRVWNSTDDDAYDDVGWMAVAAVDKAKGDNHGMESIAEGS